MIYNQLVSVVVVTYNSSKYILETLESIRRQIYENIELIISDDCSTDGTIDICKEWLNKYENRFSRIELVQSPQNSGISANCNRGYKAVRGEWIKMIAGDDILLENCISLNLKYALKHNCCILFSKVKYFKENNGVNEVFEVRPTACEELFFNYPVEEQLNMLLESNIIPCTPSVFIKSQVIKELGYADERFPFLEDYPLWLKITYSGIHLDYFPDSTVLYRFENSITRDDSLFINKRYLFSVEKFYKTVLFPLYPKSKIILKYSLILYFFKMNLAVTVFKNKKNMVSVFFIKAFSLIDPLWYKKTFFCKNK